MAIYDASVVVALFIPTDVHHEQTLRWYHRALSQGELLCAPTLLPVEVAGAIVRVTGDRELARRAVAQLEADFELFPLTGERAQEAAELAAVCALRGADAVYLALAKELGDALISLDEQQLTRGTQVVSTRRPEI